VPLRFCAFTRISCSRRLPNQARTHRILRLILKSRDIVTAFEVFAFKGSSESTNSQVSQNVAAQVPTNWGNCLTLLSSKSPSRASYLDAPQGHRKPVREDCLILSSEEHCIPFLSTYESGSCKLESRLQITCQLARPTNSVWHLLFERRTEHEVS
jgi:hypothetical protein